MVGKAWLDARCPATTLLLPLFNRTGREKMKKHTGSDKDGGYINYHHGQNRLDLEKC